MGNRLSAIVTRTGDQGSTGLGDGSRRAKDDARVHCLGEVDELNAMIGVTLSFVVNDQIQQVLSLVQHDLFDVGAELCQPGKLLIQDFHVEAIESAAEKFNETLPPLKEFILPGGSQEIAFMHLARTICRRVERSLITLKALEELNPITGQYLNRLSDLLFILARSVAHQGDSKEIYWQSKYSRLNQS
ncbi:MAG: cob(I)alamin adenosyltransferase [Gammaproteobacteria bacterium]|jgi:cob(I)alamin adenosyltransferase